MAMLAPKSSFPARLSPSGSSAMSARDGGGVGGAMSSAGSGSPAMSTITTTPNLRADAMVTSANQGYASPIDTDLSDDDGLDSIKTWDEERVGEYLRSINCAEYEKMFRKNHINGENLLELDKAVLKEMGVEKVGDRVRLFVLIKKLRTRTYASARRRNRDSFGILDGSAYGSAAHSPRSTNAGGGYRSGPSRRFSNQGDLVTLENATMASSSRPASPLTPAAAAAADLRGARQPGQSRLGQSPNIAAGPPRPPPPPASPGSQPRAGYHTKNNSSLDGSLMAALPQGQDVIRVISNGGVTKVVKIADCSTCEEVMRVTLRKFGLREDHERNYCFWVLAGIDPDPAQCRRLGDTELWRIVKDQKRPERNRLILRRVPAGEPGDAELDRAAAIAMEEAQQIHSRALEKTTDMRSQMKVQKVLGERWNSELQRPLSPVSYQDRERNLLNTTKELERPAASEATLPRTRRAIMRPFGSMRPPSELITSDLVSYFPDHAREAIDRTARLSMRRSARLSKVNSRLSVASNLSYMSGAVDEPPPIPAIADVWRSASNQIAKARSRESMVGPSPRGGAPSGASPYRDSVGSSMLGTLQEEEGSAEPNRKSYVSFTDVPSPADAAASISVTDTDGNTIVSRGSYGDGTDTPASTLGPAGSGSGSGSLDEVQQALAEDGDELDPELQSFLAGESWDDNKWMKGALIGQGSFGSVYLALHAVTGELLAVKQVEMPDPAGGGTSQSDSRKKNMTDALKREISLLRELRHPNIVQYLGCSSSSEYLNIFLEYVAGGSVQTMLSSYGALPEPLVRSFVRQILTGLSYLHNRDIIHRDIKGANILVDNKGTIKISDFGISKKMESANHNNRPSLQGSVFWMAPEVVKQTSYTRKADIWSLGCLVVEMMTGQHPFPDCSQLQAIFKIGGTMAAPTIPPGSSAEAKVFLTKTFEIDHRLRPSADELILSSFLIPIT